MVSLLDLNLSYYTIPAAFLLAMAPHAYAIALAGKNYDLANPRKTQEHCAKDTTLPKPTLRRIARAKAASANGFETLGLYAAGVVAANVSGRSIETRWLNTLTISYLVSRALYCYVYVVLQDNSRWAGVRSLVWVFGVAVWVWLFIVAGKGVNF